MKKLEAGLISGFRCVVFTKNVTLKKQKVVLGEKSGSKDICTPATSVLKQLEAAAEQANV